MTQGKNILEGFRKRWQLMLGLETVLYALGASVLAYSFNQAFLLSIIVFFATAIIASLFIKPWKPNLQSTSSYLDSKLESAEYSSGLLLSSSESLSDLAKLQQAKIFNRLVEHIKSINPPNNLYWSIITSLVLMVIGFLFYQFNLASYFQSPEEPVVPENVIIFRTKDSTNLVKDSPKLISQRVTIKYPKYTNVKSFTTSKMDIKTLDGSQVFWKLQFDSEVKNVRMESMGNDYPMTLFNDGHRKSKVLNTSGFYNFKFEDMDGNVYSSDLYPIDVFKDETPTVEIKGIKQFTSFNYDDEKFIQFTSNIIDDFGISDAHIVATVSKGTGESVKFREEKLLFDSKIPKGLKNISPAKRIDLDKLKMEPGDELYFYVEASDLKQPRPNISRSETYFAAIKDTTSYEFGAEGTLGVNRMPDYFRSQRQLIIDTEKLISERKNLTPEEFKFRSNELGFDQKALRLKYGEFMGVETESGLDIEPEESHTGESEHEEDHEDKDPLAEYTHDHDNENEHNLVDDKTHDKGKDSKNPLEEFMHDHGDPEMATQFEESLKVKMHKAMSEMWDAELYLRLYEPKKSLPYQYRALKLIQDIKNHARIYVHRIGFDPPPIKEDKRLTGKQLDKITNYRKTENIEQDDEFAYTKLSIERMGELIRDGNSLIEKDHLLFEKASTELASLAIEFPGKHLKTLQRLKQIMEGLESSKETLNEVKQGLLLAVPKPDANPVKLNGFLNDMDRLLLKELDIND